MLWQKDGMCHTRYTEDLAIPRAETFKYISIRSILFYYCEFYCVWLNSIYFQTNAGSDIISLPGRGNKSISQGYCIPMHVVVCLQHGQFQSRDSWEQNSQIKLEITDGPQQLVQATISEQDAAFSYSCSITPALKCLYTYTWAFKIELYLEFNQ